MERTIPTRRSPNFLEMIRDLQCTDSRRWEDTPIKTIRGDELQRISGVLQEGCWRRVAPSSLKDLRKTCLPRDVDGELRCLQLTFGFDLSSSLPVSRVPARISRARDEYWGLNFEPMAEPTFEPTAEEIQVSTGFITHFPLGERRVEAYFSTHTGHRCLSTCSVWTFWRQKAHTCSRPPKRGRG